MSLTALNVEQTKTMMAALAAEMVAAKDMLCEADRNIGDGDHGIGIAKGFEAVQELLKKENFTQPGQVFIKTGMTLMSTMGGASGAVFGSLFRGGGKAMKEMADLDSENIYLFLKGGLDSVQQRGGAKVGDKTMIDALSPAVDAALRCKDQSLALMMAEVVKAAEAGLEKTKHMVATTGKAKTLGERSLGHPDPGAISMTLILKTMHQFAQ